MMQIFDPWPAVIDSYDADKRTCRIKIEGITNGADSLPEAELLYPIGDKTEHTEIRIKKGDRVWVLFIRGDPNLPLILGYRAKDTGNSKSWRRWHHDNIELVADGKEFVIEAKDKVTIKTPYLLVDAQEAHFTGKITSDGDQIAGSISQQNHVHEKTQGGLGTSGKPA